MTLLARLSAAAFALAAVTAYAGSVTFTGTLTNNGSNSSCTYSAIAETSFGEWSVTCSATGTNTITVSPALCGSVCSSYSALGSNSSGQWYVNGCTFSGGSATATITQPPGLSATINADAPYTLQASASACAPATVAQVEFWTGNPPTAMLPGAVAATPPYTYLWTPVEGNYTIVARAKDSNGVYMNSSAVSIRANGAPTVTASVSPTTPRAAPASFTLSASASDSDGIASIQWIGTNVTPNPTGASYAWNNVPANTYTVFARATDTLGRSTDSAPLTVTVTSTNQPPTIAAVPTATPSGTSYTLSINASDSDGNVVRVEYVDNANGQVVATGTTGPNFTATWTSPSNGAHTFYARAIDNSGGSASSGTTTFTIVEPFRVTLASTPVSSPYYVAPATMKFTLVAYPMGYALSQLTLYMDDAVQSGAFTAGSTPGEWETSIAVPSGTHRFYVRVATSNGLAGISNEHLVTVDASAQPAAAYVCAAEQTTGIGATAGVASVNESGALSYSIPIQVPPGIAGVAPSLSLAYNSQGGNGIAGVGWALQGFSMIQRCPKNVFIDGVKSAIEYTADDPLCLDGQRLIAVQGSDRNGLIEYRTERETYSRIQSTNPLGTIAWAGTSYFKVWTKSGQILYYGWKQSEPPPPALGPWDDAFLRTIPFPVAGRETGRVWALYRIEDRVGNFARVVYENDHNAGTIRPSYVEYTGNSAMGTAPFARVTFAYETRPDTANMYLGGQVTFDTKRLKTIITSTDITPSNPNGVAVKRYTLDYGTVPSTLSARSLLRSVQECSGDGVMCLNATTFNWTDAEGGGHTFAFGTWAGSSIGANRDTTIAVDMDGDGKTDLVSRADPQQTWDVCKATGTNYSCAQWISGPRAQGNGRDDIFHFADFNGDGKADLVYLTPGGGVTLQLSTGTGFGGAINGFVTWPGYTNPSNNPYAHTVGDFDGDGRADLALYMGNFNWVFCSYNGSTFNCSSPLFIPGIEQPSNSPLAGFDFLVADLNGDGRADLAFHRNNSDQWGICYSTSQIGAFAFDCAAASTTSISDDAYRVHVADMNGDGLADMLAPDTANGTIPGRWKVCLSKGDKTFDCTYWSGPNVTHDNATLGDFNGDGRTDVAWYQPLAPVGWRVCESTGSSFNCNSGIWGPGIAPMDKLKNVRVGDFNGDGKSDLAIWTAESVATWTVGIAGGSPTDMVRRATNGMNIVSAFTYRPLTDNNVYAKGLGAAYPEIDIQSSMYVVSRVETSTLAANPWYGIDYSYRALRGHAQGGGMGGFNVRTVVDSNTDNPAVSHCTETVTFASWNDRRIGLPLRVTKRYGATIGIGECYGGTALSQVNNNWESRKSNSYQPAQNLQIWEVFLTSSSESKADLNGALLPSSQMNAPMGSIDAFGNPTAVTTDTWRLGFTTDRYSKSTTSTYYNDSSAWIIGRATRTTVTNGLPFTPVNQNFTRVSRNDYNPANGLLSGESIEPDRPLTDSQRLDTTYGYDGFGNRETVTVKGLGLPAAGRTTTTAYCVNGQSGTGCTRDGRFPTYVRNAVGQSQTRRFDARFGTQAQVTDRNNLTTVSSYDRMGRKFCETRPDGSSTGWTWSTATDVSGASYFAVTKDSSTAGADPGMPTVGQASQQHFDALNRELATRMRAFDGRWATVTSAYDYRGRKIEARKPYGDVQGIWTYTYDDLNRIKKEVGPASYKAEMVYDGVNVTTKLDAQVLGQPGTQATTRTTNNRGEVVAVLDARGSTLNLQYDPFGNMERKSVTPGSDGGAGATTTISFNARGQKIGFSDLDQGTWTYGYNALGEMTQQIDGNAYTTTFAYDDIGRVFQRNLDGIVTTWTYDANSGACGAASIGKLCRVADNKTTRDFSYDNQSRTVRTRFSLFDGRWYERFMGYDSMSRIRRVSYPFTGLTLVHTYNANGFMRKVEEPTLIGSNATWTANSRFLDGHINSESIRAAGSSRTYDALGRVNGISTPNVQASTFSYDQLGNLLSRADSVTGISETFTYDALNRLKSVTGPASRTFQYDSLGNLTGRSDIPNALQYKPGTHQLSQIGSVGFHYDNGGNLNYLDDFSRVANYWANGKVSWVATNSTTPSQGYAYEYDTEFQRAIEYPVIGNSASSKTDYFSDGITPFFEEEFNQDAAGNRSITWKHYVSTPEGVNQLIVVKNDAANTRADRLFARDHLGSTMVVFGDGTPEYESFDEWGRRRNVMGSANPPVKTDRGFTGHEMMDMVGLVNMNGRLHDPVVGRMMQADPIVQDPLNLQSYNRYSYVLNNPLSLTDPTGFSSWNKYRDSIVKPIVAAVVAYFTAGAASSMFLEWAAASVESSAIAAGAGGDIISTASVGASSMGSSGITYGTAASTIGGSAGGFAAGGIMGGNLNSALSGALAGGLSGGISGYFGSKYPFERVLANSTAGGISAKVKGGRFEDGFKSALVNSLLTYANYQLRQEQIALTRMDPEGRSDGFGYSRGLFGDLFKLGGGRFDYFAKPGECSPLGCDQKGPGKIFGIPYQSGGFADMVIESFSGPHDHFNARWFYNEQGFIDKNLTDSQRFWGEWAGNYTSSLIMAAPLAAAAIREQTYYGAVSAGRR